MKKSTLFGIAGIVASLVYAEQLFVSSGVYLHAMAFGGMLVMFSLTAADLADSLRRNRDTAGPVLMPAIASVGLLSSVLPR